MKKMKKILFTVALVVSAAFVQADEIDDMIGGTGPTNVVTSVETMRSYAFANIKGVTSVKADEVVKIGVGCFNGCFSLEEISLNGITDSQNFKGMLSGCKNLKAVYLDKMEFEGVSKMNGFPWGVPIESRVKFYFKNGIFDKNGKAVEE